MIMAKIYKYNLALNIKFIDCYFLLFNVITNEVINEAIASKLSNNIRTTEAKE